MPFRSEAQKKAMFANAPEVASKWAHKYGTKPQPGKKKKKGKRPFSDEAIERRFKKGAQ